MISFKKNVKHNDFVFKVLLKGAKQAGLAESYLDRLRNQPTYTTQKPILDKRNEVKYIVFFVLRFFNF